MADGITQTILASEGDTNQLDRVFGNCMQAAIATYFEKPLDWVPHFAQFAGLDLLLAFPGGRGTADMVRRCEKAGVEVVQVEPIDLSYSSHKIPSQ